MDGVFFLEVEEEREKGFNGLYREEHIFEEKKRNPTSLSSFQLNLMMRTRVTAQESSSTSETSSMMKAVLMAILSSSGWQLGLNSCDVG